MTFCRRTTTRLHSLRVHEAGSQAVELAVALTLPVLLAVFCGMIEGGRILFTVAVLSFAAEEAMRHARVNYDATQEKIENIARSRLVVNDPDKIISFDVFSEPDPVDQTTVVTVEIAYPFQPILPSGLSSFTLTGHSRGSRLDL